MRVVFAGTPEAALPSLDGLAESRHEVAAVVTRPEAPTGRGRRTRPSAVARRAHDLGVELLTPDNPSDPAFLERLEELEVDCVPMVAYGNLVTREALGIPRWGWVNLHFSVLPAWRGAAPVQRAIMAGDEITGATVFSVVEELDAGAVLGTITERIRDRDTTGELMTRLSEHGSRLLVRVLDHIEDGDAAAVPQDDHGASYAPKLSSPEARINWQHPDFAVDRLIRACTPVPGAWTTRADDRLKIGPVSVRDTGDLVPGEVRVEKEAVTVGTSRHDVELSTVQPPGKRAIAARDWVRGLATTQNITLQ